MVARKQNMESISLPVSVYVLYFDLVGSGSKTCQQPHQERPMHVARQYRWDQIE